MTLQWHDGRQGNTYYDEDTIMTWRRHNGGRLDVGHLATPSWWHNVMIRRWNDMMVHSPLIWRLPYPGIDISCNLLIHIPVSVFSLISIYLSIYLHIYLSIYLSFYLYIYLSIYQSTNISIYKSIYYLFCSSVYHSFYQSLPKTSWANGTKPHLIMNSPCCLFRETTKCLWH